MNDDELDQLLTPKDRPFDRASQDALFAKTLPGLRPWRIAKPIASLGLLCVGIGIGWFAKPTPPPERIIETVIEKVPVPVERLSPGETIVELTPERLELEAEKATDRTVSAKFYQQAGDAFLKANQVASALRCYRQYLTESGDDGLPVRHDDSWLLTSIKQSRH